MKDLGTLSSFLGIDFERGTDYITMSQSRYLSDVLIRFGLNDCKLRNTPCEQNHAAYILDETSDSKKTDNDTKLYAFCDADWASSLDNRKSITSYGISINPSGPPISWRSRKQASVALSTCEAEYMALSLTAHETAYL